MCKQFCRKNNIVLTDLRCPPDKDVWGIVWPSTEAGLTSIRPCPGAADVGMFSHVSLCFFATLITAAGNATRTCHDNQMWDDTDVELSVTIHNQCFARGDSPLRVEYRASLDLGNTECVKQV